MNDVVYQHSITIYLCIDLIRVNVLVTIAKRDRSILYSLVLEKHGMTNSLSLSLSLCVCVCVCARVCLS